MKLETEEDYEAIEELAGEVIDFFAENALEHERCALKYGVIHLDEDGHEKPTDRSYDAWLGACIE
jgi:hypothetical protein